jgi:hypothetical protein
MQHHDSKIGFICGAIGGVGKLLFDTHFSLNIQFDPDFFSKLMEVGIYAAFSGLLGVMSKDIYLWIKKSLKKRK